MSGSSCGIRSRTRALLIFCSISNVVMDELLAWLLNFPRAIPAGSMGAYRIIAMYHGAITVCPWLNGKQWVYSITFDEALIELHRFAVGILEEFKCPGHLEAVVGHLGKVRQIGN